VNGILFPGGGLGGQQLEEYFAVVQEIVDQAVEWNRAGDPFVVWGTCMGFQVVCAAVARNLSVIQGGYHGLYPAMLPITFSAAQPSSRMFGTLTTPAHILSVLSSQNSTLNWHHAGVSPNAFVAVQSLGAGLKILSTNVDVNGKSFVSSVEGTDGTAIFATQFHPERIQFEYTNDLIGHKKGDIEVSEYLALFIAEQLKKNNHTFSSPSDAEAHSIHNYPIVNYGLGYELYWLP
jgi:gamma-glutamyl hydrolase